MTVVQFIGGPYHGRFLALPHPLPKGYEVAVAPKIDLLYPWDDGSQEDAPVEIKVARYELRKIEGGAHDGGFEYHCVEDPSEFKWGDSASEG